MNHITLARPKSAKCRVGQNRIYALYMTVCMVISLLNFPFIHRIYRVGQKHTYTVYIPYFWQGNHHIYGHIRCIYTVLANPSLGI